MRNETKHKVDRNIVPVGAETEVDQVESESPATWDYGLGLSLPTLPANPIHPTVYTQKDVHDMTL